MEQTVKLLPHGDRAISVVFPEEISEEVNARVLALCGAIDEAKIPGIINCVPGYHTLLVEYDPLQLTYGQTAGLVRPMTSSGRREVQGRIVELPVCYGGELGPDLEAVAAHTGLVPEEVISRHAGNTYRVYMLGFRPGFPYLGGLDPALATPRLPTPRHRIEGGSVGIAGAQTGVYPEASPGGWNLIGRTPVKLFDEKRGPLLRPGDDLRFVPVDRPTYDAALETGAWPL